MKDRIYICHTYYHVYVTCLKELNLSEKQQGKATILLSSLSNDFETLGERLEASGLFEQVMAYDEKKEECFPELAKYRKDQGNIVKNMLARIRFTRKFAALQAPYVPVDLKQYGDIYVYCDSDPIGYYLSQHKIKYHAVEDGLNCIKYFDTARYDNRGHFRLKAWLSARNLIFIQGGYNKYCIDMEVNDVSILDYPCKKYKEVPREPLVKALTQSDKDIIMKIFIKDYDRLMKQLTEGLHHEHKILILTEPLCALPVRVQIFKDIIAQYGQEAQVILKPHPRDELDYSRDFGEYIIIDRTVPMEMLNFIEGIVFEKVISVFTVTDAIHFAKEIVRLGDDFMDKYEAPEVHRKNEQIG